MFISLSVYLPAHLSACRSVGWSVGPSVYLSVCLSASPSVCLSVHLSVCPSVCVCLPARLSVCLSVCLSVSACLPARLPTYSSVCLSVCLDDSTYKLFILAVVATRSGKVDGQRHKTGRRTHQDVPHGSPECQRYLKASLNWLIEYDLTSTKPSKDYTRMHELTMHV